MAAQGSTRRAVAFAAGSAGSKCGQFGESDPAPPAGVPHAGKHDCIHAGRQKDPILTLPLPRPPKYHRP